MNKRFVCMCVLSLLALSVAAPLSQAQPQRGRAELDAAGGKIVIDYGRPQLKGRDPFTWQQEGSYWRMGSNDMTTITVPVELAFGKAKLPRGTYGMWLLKLTGGGYELVFNSVNSGMGMSHDKTKDVANIPLKKEGLTSPVETFTIELSRSSSGGSIAMSWGTARLSADFDIPR